MSDLIYAPATLLAGAIRRGEITAEQVVAAHLERIAAVNPQLNAVVALRAEEALAEAREADDRLALGLPVGPLHGVPFTIKDSFDTAGVVSTWGTVGRRNTVPAEDATVVKRLKAAGAVLVGKSNTPEFTYAYETDNTIYGRTNNPYDLARTPGGSSGGAAAIVAAGGAAFDIGTDTGGSIRVPAHYCGIAGIKPTAGRVSRYGHAIGPGSILDTLTQVGPMARSVADLITILPLIAGPDHRDPALAPVPLRDPARVNLTTLRAVYYTDDGNVTPEPAVVAAVTQAADMLACSGVELHEMAPPGVGEAGEILPALFRGWDGGAWVRLLLERCGTDEADTTLDRYLTARTGTPAELVRLVDRWDAYKARMLAFMDDVDLIIAPVNAHVAIGHGEFRQKYAGFSYTMAYNLTGWPAAVVRVGTTGDGLPVGVQLVARPWREDIVLAAAAFLETAFGGWQPPSL